ncbi:CAP domain-containing protein [Cellulomonas soli]
MRCGAGAGTHGPARRRGPVRARPSRSGAAGVRRRQRGENLALGYADAAATVTGWMNSPGHRENILRAGYTSIGVACTLGSHGQLCAQVFLG